MKLVAYCKECDAALEGPLWQGPLRCPDCNKEFPLQATPSVQEDRVERCALCGYEHFHLRKDFPRQIGLLIVLVAAALCFTHIFPPGLFFLPLIIASAIDLLLYLVLPWKVVCYVCDSEYKGAKLDPAWKAYDLETATECRRLKWPRPSGSPAPAA